MEMLLQCSNGKIIGQLMDMMQQENYWTVDEKDVTMLKQENNQPEGSESRIMYGR